MKYEAVTKSGPVDRADDLSSTLTSLMAISRLPCCTHLWPGPPAAAGLFAGAGVGACGAGAGAGGGAETEGGGAGAGVATGAGAAGAEAGGGTAGAAAGWVFWARLWQTALSTTMTMANRTEPIDFMMLPGPPTRRQRYVEGRPLPRQGRPRRPLLPLPRLRPWLTQPADHTRA
jgi:hypothetical protein